MRNSELKRDHPGETKSCFQMLEAMRPMRAQRQSAEECRSPTGLSQKRPPHWKWGEGSQPVESERCASTEGQGADVWLC